MDKHAFHERMLFDKVKNERGKAPVFIPIDDQRLCLWKNYLESLGFEIDESNVVLAVPKWAYGKEGRILRAILDELREESPVDPSYEELARIACRAAVKAGDASSSLDAEYVAKVIEDMGEDLTCPHGRPVVVKLDMKDLDALFKRRM